MSDKININKIYRIVIQIYQSEEIYLGTATTIILIII